MVLTTSRGIPQLIVAAENDPKECRANLKFEISNFPKMSPIRPGNVSKMITFWHSCRSSTRLGARLHVSEWYRALFRTYLRRQDELWELSIHRCHPNMVFQQNQSSREAPDGVVVPPEKTSSFFTPIFGFTRSDPRGGDRGYRCQLF